MKQWSDNHPQGKLLARKRAAILDAAQEAFMQLGYEGASMESIANAAGVSIMTLYRHARRKEDLFAAVIANACDHSSKEKLDKMMHRPLKEVLIKVGVAFQEKLTSPQIMALLRVVITEIKRFPNLAEAVYMAFVDDWAVTLDASLAQREDLKKMSSKARRKLCDTFFSGLVRTDTLRVLLGMKGATAAEYLKRAQTSAEEMLAEVA